MDKTQLQQQIALYYSKLPSSVQQAFSSMSWLETLRSIGVRYGLKDTQIENLGTETTLVLLGIVHPEDYESNLISELNMPKDVVDKIVVEINENILKNIRPDLEKTFVSNVQNLIEEKYGDVNKLDERFSKLPKEVQDAIVESNYQSKLYNIAESKKISIEQMGVFEEVTNKVLLGIIHPDKYVTELKAKISLPDETVNELVDSVNENILKNIREILKTHWGNRDGTKSSAHEDEVPIPPYLQNMSGGEIKPATVVTPMPQKEEVGVRSAPAPTTLEQNIYKQTGIEMVDDGKEDSGDLMHDIIKSKLTAPTASKQVASDHSTPKVSSPTAPATPPPAATQTPKSSDPYRESIE